jgi:hypothetical protein
MKRFNLMMLLILPALSLAPAVRAELYVDGFLQTLHGARLESDNPTSTEMTASETRLQVRAEHFGDAGEFFTRLDFYYDGADSGSYDWELREGYLKFRLGQNFDFKFGRQIITWGTGDLIFINDVFAKDYRSFFVGRDDQYLKAPQNALRTDYYSPLGSWSLVWTPRFEANRLPTGRRLSYFNGQRIVGDGYYFDPDGPEAKLDNSELALRFSRTVGSFNTALYFYRGFYKNPRGVEMVMTDNGPMPNPIYPKLMLYGASIRGPLFGGIVWLEGGYYDSRWDRGTDTPFMPNSQISGLFGFERQVATNLTANFQWQIEQMLDYDEYVSDIEMMKQMQPGEYHVHDEIRHLMTSRVTKLMMDELLTLSAFAFFSPTDEDVYARFSAAYKYSDELSLSIGANLFDGNYSATQFGQFQLNDNVYMKATYGF